MRTVTLKKRETMRMTKQMQDLIVEAPAKSSEVEMTIGIDLGDVWSHYCTLNQEGEVVDRGRFRTAPSGVEKWFTNLPPVRIAMRSGNALHLDSQQLQEMTRGHCGERARVAGDLP
jgi:transposase